MAEIIHVSTTNPVGSQIHTFASLLRAARGQGETIRGIVAELGDNSTEFAAVAGIGSTSQADALRDTFESAMILLTATDAQIQAMAAADVKTRVGHLVVLMATVVPSNT